MMNNKVLNPKTERVVFFFQTDYRRGQTNGTKTKGFKTKLPLSVLLRNAMRLVASVRTKFERQMTIF